MPMIAIAQEEKSNSAANATPAAKRAQRKKAKAKWKEQRILEHETKKAVKQHHKKLQTKKTLKEMKREKKKSDKLRENKKKNFFAKMFRRK